MNDKPIAFLLYGVIGLLLALCPIVAAMWHPYFQRSARLPGTWRGFGALSVLSSALVLVIFLAIRPIPATYGTLLFIASIWTIWRLNIRSFSALLLTCAVLVGSIKLIWWKTAANALNPVSAIVGLLAYVAMIELMRRPATSRMPTATFRLTCLVFVCLCLFFGFSTGLTGADEILFSTWHHWSSYIGPAELLRSGARIFYDFPVQYGLGPTGLIAAACPLDCWTGMYYVVGASNVLYTLIIAVIALKLMGANRKPGETVVVLTATLAACFFYTAYPPSLATSAVAPSTGGLRFLPSAIMLLFLVQVADKPWSAPRVCLGQAIWLFAALWAPESAFHVTFIWWPYHIWRTMVSAPDGSNKIVVALRSALVLMAFAASSVALLSISYFAIFDVFPTIDGMFAYVLYPPAPIPFDFNGAFVCFSGIFLMASISVAVQISQTTDQLYLNRSIPIILGYYAVASYYLGRSIDNNLLNLMPFVLLTLLLAFTSPTSRTLRAISTTAICCVVMLTLSFGWSAYWAPAIEKGGAFSIRPGTIKEAFDLSNAATRSAMDRRERPRNPDVQTADIQEAVDYIRTNYNESATLSAPPLLLLTSQSKPWSAMHIPANMWFMPLRTRHDFLLKAMQRMQRAGWVIVQTDVADQVAEGGLDLARDLESVYLRDVERRFGSYTAIRYLPK